VFLQVVKLSVYSFLSDSKEPKFMHTTYYELIFHSFFPVFTFPLP
jgi:hypothetical protein